MNKTYVLVNIKSNGLFNKDDEKHITFLDAIKVDNDLNHLDRLKINVDKEGRSYLVSEKEAMIKFIEFGKDSRVITYNGKFTFSFILKALYKNNIINNFKFKYVDIKDIISNFCEEDVKLYSGLISENNCDNLLGMLKFYLSENNIGNLNELFLAQQFRGRVFRGLSYPKYLCDVMSSENRYYGYIIDFSIDKYVSYYTFLKELNKEYFGIDEVNTLKRKGAKVIMNISYFCDESLSFADCYSIQAVGSTKIDSKCSNLINGINKFIMYNQKNEKVKLILWGTIDNLRQQYKIIDKDSLQFFISLICGVKEPWEFWGKEDLKIFD